MMSYLAVLGAVLTGVLGFIALVRPMSIARFVSILPSGKLGVSEIRATYGGFFFGLAIFALCSQEPMAYVSLGIGWLSAAVVRLLTVAFHHRSPKNIVAVVFEAIIGCLCLSMLL